MGSPPAAAGVVQISCSANCLSSAPLRVQHLAKFRAPLFYLIFIFSVTVTDRFKVRVSCRVRVRFNNSHMLHKSRTASYLASNATYLA